jgi:hypothetical protein
VTEVPPADVTVLLDAAIPVGEEDELNEALAELGFTPTAKELPTVRGADSLNALALMIIPLHAFLTATGSRLAADAYPKFKNGIRRILNRQPQSVTQPQPLVVQDTATGIKIVMERDLPDEAYEALRKLDLSSFKQGPVDWDVTRKRWRSLTDEAESGDFGAPAPAATA